MLVNKGNSKEMKSKRIFKFVYSSTKGYRFIFFVLFICVIGNALTTLLFPSLIGKIVDALFYEKDVTLFFMFFLTYMGVYLGNQLINCGLNYCYAHLKATYLVNIRKKCFARIQQVKAQFFITMNTGDIIKRIHSDVDKFLDFIHFNLFFSVSDALRLIGSIIYIFFVSKLLGLICILIVPIMYCVTRHFMNILLIKSKKLEKDKGILAAWIFEIMSGLSEIKLLNANQKMYRDYMQYSKEIVDSEIDVSYKNIQVQRINVLILLIGQLIFYIISAYCIMDNTISVGMFVAGCTYFSTCSTYFKNFINRISDAVKNIVALERVGEIFLYDEEKSENDGVHMKSLGGKIDFLNVAFSYDTTRILNNLSFGISQGEHIAIVGKSGEGKSTIVNLLCGFYEKSSGKILIDDVEIEKYSLKCLREKLGVVTQHSVVFSGTVRYNLIFSDDKTRDDDLWNVLMKVDLYDEIKNTEDELNTLIGAGGRELSGGQKQRLVIARMLLKKPDILILDEATSAIDGDSQLKIGEIVKSEYRNNTVISIAHRFSTILQADRILVLDHGCMIAQGNHSDLYKSCDVYKSLYDNAKSLE